MQFSPFLIPAHLTESFLFHKIDIPTEKTSGSCAMKHFIHLNDFTRQEAVHIFALADKLRQNAGAASLLSGKTIVLFFPGSSIRTRVSFEKGIQQLGGNTILFPPAALDKKEDLRDVIGYLENWADMLIVRHPDLSLLTHMAQYSHIPIINAMTAVNHPCEILSDLYSLSKRDANYADKHYLFVGPKGNIGNTWKAASEWMGFPFTQCCPKGYEIEGANVCYEIDRAFTGQDIICTDSIPSTASEDFKGWQVTLERLKHANAGVCFNPCPPFFRGEEVAADVIDSGYFVGYEFKKHLLEVQQSMICYLLGCM